MKNIKKAFIVLASVAVALPLMDGCKRGPNDPGISLKSRDSRISAVWSLSGGTITITETKHEVLEWDDNDCENIAGGQEAYDETVSRTRTFTLSSTAIAFNQSASSDRDWFTGGAEFPDSDNEENNMDAGICDGGEWAEGQTITRTITITDYKMTIRKDGTYEVSFNYSLTDSDFNLYFPDQNGNTQQGNTLSGTYTVTGNWWWSDQKKNKSGIVLENFPMIDPTVSAEYEDGDNNGEDKFDYNYVSDITVTNNTITFTLDRLANKELTLTANISTNDMDKDVSESFEGYDTNNNQWIDCISTVTITNTTTITGTWNFTSDGKNVK